MISSNDDWPVLTSYTDEYLKEVAMPLGGIGTGTVSLGGRGDLRDFELMQRPGKGFLPDIGFFCISCAEPGSGRRWTKLLEGPLDIRLNHETGMRGKPYGLPRFRSAHFHAAYPLAQVILEDASMPVSVRLEAFNPLLPTKEDDSGLPFVMLRYVVENHSDQEQSVSICGNMSNFVGWDGWENNPGRRYNEYRVDRDHAGFVHRAREMNENAANYGSAALVLLNAAQFDVTHREAWKTDKLIFRGIIDFWNDFSFDGRLDPRPAAEAVQPVASLAGRRSIGPGENAAWPFLFSWHFPNRRTWTPRPEEGECGDDCDCRPEERVGNFYARAYDDAWDAAMDGSSRLAELERGTVGFVQTVTESDLDPIVKEAALYNLPALRSQTSFRTADGYFYGFEGCGDNYGCCYGANPHVWNYEHATALLFGKLSQRMREVELLHATDADGVMSFRVNLPLSRATEMGRTAADGQMGCIVKLFRDWKLSGDDLFLAAMWPAAKRALEFAWLPGSWDEDQDGVMEGVQHNTTDLEFSGPNPMMAGWYTAALYASSEMASHEGDPGFADKCRRLAEQGKAWVAEHLFNGEYFEQDVRIPKDLEALHRGLATNIFMEIQPGELPGEQPADGCMTDQVIGQYMAKLVDLPDVFLPEQNRAALDAIYRYNFKKPLFDYANPIRTFAANDEGMVVMGSYPKGMPEVPCFRFFENWTGVEYAYAVNLVYAGEPERALEIVRAIRERFDGKKRNPFDEPECGRHYARSMAAWSLIPAFTGFSYDGRSGWMRFARPDEDRARRPFFTGYGFGTVTFELAGPDPQVSIELTEGAVTLSSFTVGDGEAARSAQFSESIQLSGGDRIELRLPE